MKYQPKLSILRSLLFTYNIENLDDSEREIFIASKNINDDKELIELLDKLTKPEFIKYERDEREWHINTLQHFLNTDENFESVFYLFDTYFNDEITDKRQFMKVLLDCLGKYNEEVINNE
ncbi:hypothetical protein [Pseudomonas grimontii]|jgi:hypothetical protein|uniref:hypothetical protein n=1 Tax=Pseudomonas grimontii TaxID=129847 RepID=UPI0028E30210|nr:hypothetical protein [Pseudomonas grimontii]